MNPEKFSCIRTVDKTVKIPLWDMYTTTEYKGIEAALDKWKRQYEKQVGGIVVNYKNVSIPSRLGFHSDRGSYAIYNVRATFDVFCPKVGEIVKGKINRVSSEHIGCLIAETINVSIRLPRDSPSGLSKYIYLDREILFEIRSFSCKPRALCVNGEVTAKCVELMDEYYPVADEFSYEPTSQAVFGDVPSDPGDLQVDLSILGTDGKKKKGKKRGRDETEEENATDSPRVKKIKKDLDLTGSQEEEASYTDTPKKGKKKSSTDISKLKKSKKGLIATNSPGMTQVDGDTSSTDTPKKGKKRPKDSPKPKKSLISANSPEMTQEGGDTSSTDTLKKEGSMDSPKVKQIQRLQEELSFIDTPKKAKKKKSSSTDSPKLSQEDSSSTESAKKVAPISTDSSQESQSSSTESDKKEKKKSSNKKAKKKASKSTESLAKIKKELLSSTEDEGSKKKSKKKPKKKSKDSAKSKDKKKSSKKKGKVTASGDILKKDKKKSKKSSKKDDKSKKKSKKDKSEKKKKTKLSNDGDVTLKEIKSEGM